MSYTQENPTKVALRDALTQFTFGESYMYYKHGYNQKLRHYWIGFFCFTVIVGLFVVAHSGTLDKPIEKAKTALDYTYECFHNLYEAENILNVSQEDQKTEQDLFQAATIIEESLTKEPENETTSQNTTVIVTMFEELLNASDTYFAKKLQNASEDVQCIWRDWHSNYTHFLKRASDIFQDGKLDASEKITLVEMIILVKEVPMEIRDSLSNKTAQFFYSTRQIAAALSRAHEKAKTAIGHIQEAGNAFVSALKQIKADLVVGELSQKLSKTTGLPSEWTVFVVISFFVPPHVFFFFLLTEQIHWEWNNYVAFKHLNTFTEDMPSEGMLVVRFMIMMLLGRGLHHLPMMWTFVISMHAKKFFKNPIDILLKYCRNKAAKYLGRQSKIYAIFNGLWLFWYNQIPLLHIAIIITVSNVVGFCTFCVLDLCHYNLPIWLNFLRISRIKAHNNVMLLVKKIALCKWHFALVLIFVIMVLVIRYKIMKYTKIVQGNKNAPEKPILTKLKSLSRNGKWVYYVLCLLWAIIKTLPGVFPATEPLVKIMDTFISPDTSILDLLANVLEPFKAT